MTAASRSTPASAGTSPRSSATSRPSWPPTARAAGRHGSPARLGRDAPVLALARPAGRPAPRYRELAEHLPGDALPPGDVRPARPRRRRATATRPCGSATRIAEHLPALLALSANSPFWCGRATGLHSHRVEVMGASPTGGLPPRLGGWDDYVRLVDRLTAAGLSRRPRSCGGTCGPAPSTGRSRSACATCRRTCPRCSA